MHRLFVLVPGRLGKVGSETDDLAFGGYQFILQKKAFVRIKWA
jgi:hypothetical protein